MTISDEIIGNGVGVGEMYMHLICGGATNVSFVDFFRCKIFDLAKVPLRLFESHL